MIYPEKNKGVWAEATKQLESRIGPAKINKRAKMAGVAGEAGEAAAQAIISTLVERKRKIR